MRIINSIPLFLLFLLIVPILLIVPAAQATEITDLAAKLEASIATNEAQSAYIFNTLLFLIGGFLVMWMAAGFAMLEAGLVRTKNVSMQCLKNISLYAVAGIMFWLVGYEVYCDLSCFLWGLLERISGDSGS